MGKKIQVGDRVEMKWEIGFGAGIRGRIVSLDVIARAGSDKIGLIELEAPMRISWTLEEARIRIDGDPVELARLDSYIELGAVEGKEYIVGPVKDLNKIDEE